MALLTIINAIWLYTVPLQLTFYELVRLTVRCVGVFQRCIFQQLFRLFVKYTPLEPCIALLRYHSELRCTLLQCKACQDAVKWMGSLLPSKHAAHTQSPKSGSPTHFTRGLGTWQQRPPSMCRLRGLTWRGQLRYILKLLTQFEMKYFLQRSCFLIWHTYFSSCPSMKLLIWR